MYATNQTSKHLQVVLDVGQLRQTVSGANVIQVRGDVDVCVRTGAVRYDLP